MKVQIRFTFSENQNVEINRVFGSFEDARKHLLSAAHSAPETGYDKTYFEVTLTPGSFQWSGRLDLTCDLSSADLKDHMLRQLNYWEQHYPKKFNEAAHWLTFLSSKKEIQ